MISFDGIAWKVNNPVDSSGKSLGYIGRIAVDRRGFIWTSIRNAKGLAVFDGAKWICNEPEYLQSSGVFDIVADRENTIWLGSGDGVYLLRQE